MGSYQTRWGIRVRDAGVRRRVLEAVEMIRRGGVICSRSVVAKVVDIPARRRRVLGTRGTPGCWSWTLQVIWKKPMMVNSNRKTATQQVKYLAADQCARHPGSSSTWGSRRRRGRRSRAASIPTSSSCLRHFELAEDLLCHCYRWHHGDCSGVMSGSGLCLQPEGLTCHSWPSFWAFCLAESIATKLHDLEHHHRLLLQFCAAIRLHPTEPAEAGVDLAAGAEEALLFFSLRFYQLQIERRLIWCS